MIGHFLNNLDLIDEDRILTHKLGEVNWNFIAIETPADVTGCLLQAVRWQTYAREIDHARSCGRRSRLDHGVGHRYDALVRRFGISRTANAIRNRIFANQVRRKLTQPQREYVTV